MTTVEVPNDNQQPIPKKQWCLCPLNSDDMFGDILLPDQGEVKIGRAILGISDRKISRTHLGLRIQDRELSIKLLHKNPCHVKKVGQSIAQDIPSDRFITLNEGDQISLMCAYAYAVDFKDISAAQPPKFRARTSSVLTTATEPDCIQIARSQSAGSRHHFVNYDPVPHFDRDVVAEEDEIIDDALPQGDLDSHMSWRDPDKAVPGPDRYHQDWLVIDVTEEVAKVAPEIKARNSDDEDGSMFSNHSEEKCSYRVLYSQNQAKPKSIIWRNICGNTPKENE